MLSTYPIDGKALGVRTEMTYTLCGKVMDIHTGVLAEIAAIT